MKIDYLRASSIGCFKDCEFKYFLDYSVGLQSPAGKKALLGTIFHAVYEILAKCKKTGHYKLKDKYSDPEYLLRICWNKYTTENPQFEYTMADYKFCQKLLEAMVGSRFCPLKLDILAIEKQFEIDLDVRGFGKPPCKLRGTIDLVTKEDEHTLHVIDWKTGERKDWITGQPKEIEDFEKDIQLLVYNLALWILYPEYKYRIFTIYFVRDGGPFTVTFGPESIEKTVQMLRKYYNTIKTTESPKRLKDDLGRSREFFKCKYVCHYGKTTDSSGFSLCEKYNQVLKKNSLEKAAEKIYSLSIEGRTIEKSRRNDYSRAKIAKSSLQERKDLDARL